MAGAHPCGEAAPAARRLAAPGRVLPPATVRIPAAAYSIGRTPVTRAQYAPFLQAGRAPVPPWWGRAGFDGDEQPVVGVTWHDAVAYAGWLGETFSGRWRLPSEAEWETAMRGGLAGAPTAWGDVLPEGEVPGGPLAGPWPVGRGTPNGYGVMDPGTMVHEWCLDDYVPGAGDAGPPPDAPARKASRGGSWRHRVRWSPPHGRSSLPPGFRYADYGFRVLREEP